MFCLSTAIYPKQRVRASHSRTNRAPAPTSLAPALGGIGGVFSAPTAHYQLVYNTPPLHREVVNRTAPQLPDQKGGQKVATSEVQLGPDPDSDDPDSYDSKEEHEEEEAASQQRVEEDAVSQKQGKEDAASHQPVKEEAASQEQVPAPSKKQSQNLPKSPPKKKRRRATKVVFPFTVSSSSDSETD